MHPRFAPKVGSPAIVWDSSLSIFHIGLVSFFKPSEQDEGEFMVRIHTSDGYIYRGRWHTCPLDNPEKSYACHLNWEVIGMLIELDENVEALSGIDPHALSRVARSFTRQNQ